jgi:hypothetical protein
MKRRFALVLVVLALVMALVNAVQSDGSGPVLATQNANGEYQYTTTFVSLASGVPSLLYQPIGTTPTSHIGVFVMHSGGDYLQFLGARELAKRGYTVLAPNNSISKSGFTCDTPPVS